MVTLEARMTRLETQLEEVRENGHKALILLEQMDDRNKAVLDIVRGQEASLKAYIDEKVAELSARLDAVELAVRHAHEAIEENRKAIEENRKAIEENRKAIEENRKAIEENRKAIEENRKAIEENRKAIDRIEARFDRFEVKQESETRRVIRGIEARVSKLEDRVGINR